MSRFLYLALVFAALCSAQIAAPAAPPDPLTLARIEGRVLSTTGSPVPNVSIELRITEPATDLAGTTTSDVQGRFVFDQIEPGQYRVSAAPAGYVPTERNGISDSFTLQRAEKKAGLVLRLIPAASISGRVTDRNGDPLSKPRVELLRKAWSNGHIELRLTPPTGGSAADGTFWFSEITPGPYYLAVENDGITTYYPNVAEPSLALPVNAIAGTESAGTEIRLPDPPRFHVRGQVLDPDTKEPVNALVRLASNESVINPMVSSSTQVRKGYFEFDRVLPGSYLVQATPIPVKSSDGISTVPPLAGIEIINVGRADLDDVEVQFRAATSVTGKVTLEGGGPASGVHQVRFYLVDDTAAGAPKALEKDGSFSLKSVEPGFYRIQVGGCDGCTSVLTPTGYYVKSIRFNGQDATTKPINVIAEVSSILDIVVSPGAAEVSGIARDSENRPVPNARVTLWSDGIFRTALTRNDGSFDFRDLAPGEYRILAWEQMPQGLDGIPAFRDKFLDKAVKFKVEAGGHVHYEVPMVGHDAIQVEAAKLP